MKLIASWGSSGAGKSTIALAVASKLVQHKKEVLVIGADSRTPALPIYLPTVTIPSAGSAGGLLEVESSVTEAALKGRIHKHPKTDHLYFMGLTSGEIAGITYKPTQRQAVAGLLALLQQSPFTHVIVDCDTNPIYDPLTLYALENANVVLRVATPDIKGHESIKAQLAWLGNNEAFQIDRHVCICNQVFPATPQKEALALLGNIHFTLPWAAPVWERFMAGELLAGLHEPAAILFENQIAMLVNQLLKEADDG